MPSRLRIYKKLLGLYPKPYRDTYADQMAQTLTDMLADQPSKAARARVWVRAGIDLPLGIMQQNIMYVGDSMAHQTPHYVKRNALISTALIMPFFITISSRTFQHNTRGSSDIVQSSLYIIFLALPLLAFSIVAATLVAWARHDELAWWRSVLNIRRSWLLTVVGVVAIGIPLLVLFHDSVHCVAGNPIRELHNPHQTLQCISSGFLGGKV